MKMAILAAAVGLLAHGTPAGANADEAAYKQRAARTDLALFREMDRAGNGFLNKEDVRGDLNLGPRFDDIDINRDGIVTLQELQTYIEKTYGVISPPN